MAEIKQIFQLTSIPGIKRDGTELDGDNYSDGQWVRFQRGRPKKMGGYTRITDQLRGPIYSSLVWSQSTMNNIFTFHEAGIQLVQVSATGTSGSVVDRTPSGFIEDSKIIWSVDTMFDAAAGSNKTMVLALPASLQGDIDDQTERTLYVGEATVTTAFTVVADSNAVASGGVFVSSPYAVLYGSNGKVTWSNANEPQNYTSGDAGTARITGSKIIKGMSLRSGSGAGGLLWSLDSVIRMDWIGGSQIFRFSTLSRQSSILSANSVVEYDGNYYWVGIDRFMMSNGSQVAEVPNDMNLNWFFDGLNNTQRSKVWGMKIPRYGEIWWFFPKDENTECSHAVILNVREKTWYDIELTRFAGYHQQVFNNPVMSGQDISNQRLMKLTISVGSFLADDLVTGGTSGATGIVRVVDGANGFYYIDLSTVTEFEVSEVLTNNTRSGTASISVYESLYSMYIHEYGSDAILGETYGAIDSWVTTADLGLPTGGPAQNAQQGMNRWTRLVRIEPDFKMTGDMTVEVLGREFANSDEVVTGPFTFSNTDPKIDLRVQQRHLRLKFTSNTSNGSYEMGKVLLHTEPGDIRS